MRSHYWTCSKFADWLRGTPKGGAKTSEGWDEWTTEAQRYNPVRYWLAEEGLDYLQKVVFYVPDTLYSIKYYVNNRWVTKTNALTAHPRDIKPGDWSDVGNRFLPCLFNELVDFVEVELAWWHIAWDEEARKQFKSPWYATGWFRWRTWRSPECGLANLEWQRQLRWKEDEVGKDFKGLGELTPQAVKAQEILDLYTWWTTTYRNRPDPHDASGWTAYCELSRLANGGKLSWGGDKTPELKKASKLAHKELRRIEAAYEKEDEAMMIRLIKVRHGLWT
ncbi:hypothetical protein UFOVP71_249 [uncultured Caudovirales phage]|uniref:Uncharacterized protein n=1 Tax=uncultured Caudovirales phage TaxID=2100421 RepID=A0A6J5TAR7_9CAUD|nr:hypothetical protein UFOVP71_249 [uncultured Caudovirales phage]